MKIEHFKYKGRDSLEVTYDSPFELHELLTNPDHPHRVVKGKLNYENDYANSFVPVTATDAYRMLVEGWTDEKAVDMSEVSEMIRAELVENESGTFQIKWRPDVGTIFDIGRYQSGDPDCVGRLTPAPLKQEEVTVRVMCGYQHEGRAVQVTNRGAAILAVIDALRKKYHVKVDLVLNSEHAAGKGTVRQIIRMDTKNRYSRNLIAFAIANIGFHRRCIFGAIHALTGQESPGGTEDWKSNEKGVIFFTALHNRPHRYNTVESATAYVKELVKNALDNDEENKR